MSKSLLVPTDFSANACTAILYAAALAERFNWRLHILHTYNNRYISRVRQHWAEDFPIAETKTAEENMKDVEALLQQQSPAIHCTTACMIGDLTEVVLKLLQEETYSFIVMGTKGAGRIKQATLGSNTFSLVKCSPIGVLAIPEEITDFQLKKVGLLSNFKDIETSLLDTFTSRIPAVLDLTLLHVTENDQSPADADVSFWKDKLASQFAFSAIHYVEKNAVYRLDYNMPIPRCIDWMLEKAAIDTLLVSYTRKSFFAQLFSRSLTKAIAHNLTLPTYFKRAEHEGQ